MKCFERLVKDFTCSSLPSSFDFLQFAHRDITNLFHTTLTHLDKGRGNYVRILVIDYSSAFNSLVPFITAQEMRTVGLIIPLCKRLHKVLTRWFGWAG